MYDDSQVTLCLCHVSMSSFSSNVVHSLSLSTSQDDYYGESTASQTNQSPQAVCLYNTLINLKSPLDNNALINALSDLNECEKSFTALSTSGPSIDEEERVLKHLVVSRIAIGLYAQALDLCLKEASEADSEAEWWSSIGRSYNSVAWYLVASEYW